MIKEELLKRQRKLQRADRTRMKLRKAAVGKLRLSVHASNRYFYAQIIDDTKGATVLTASEKELESKSSMTKVQRAELLGKALAEKAKDKKISDVVFDKGSYRYHGRVKAFADGAREGGLKF